MKKQGLSHTRLRLVLCLLTAMLMLLCTAAAQASSKPLQGRTISVMGDSISTYMGWSDKLPITDESCTYRYGEPYYGLPGTDCHNTILKVEDTWWHQAAQETGAQILMSNAGNSTGLLCASYPANADWEHYLSDMLAYKSRPDHMGANGQSPDIIALYIGSNDVAKVASSHFGRVEDVDFDQLITRSGSGYTYAKPDTVAEAYCILLHKLSVNYPQAEVYCFTVLPNSGGKLTTLNKRLAACGEFNEMIRGVAGHYGAHVVELLEAFDLDPDGNCVATESDMQAFKSYFYNDPHPNAAGFDVITRAFVDTIEEHSRYIVEVETTAGNMEDVETQVSIATSGTTAVITRRAENYLTEGRMTVNYSSTATLEDGEEKTFNEVYTSDDQARIYHAEGGRTRSVQSRAPMLTVQIPLEAGATAGGSTPGTAAVITGDPRTAPDDGIYDYTVTRVKKKGSAAVQTADIVVSEGSASGTYTDMQAIVSNTFGDGENEMIIPEEKLDRPTGPEDAPAVPEGYDYVYLGSDQFSCYYAAFGYTVPQPEYPSETPAYEGNGVKTYMKQKHSTFTLSRYNLVIPRIYLKSGVVEQETIARWASLQQYTLADRNGNLVTAYCADQLTNTQDGFGYNMVNLNDASYYSAEDAARIRTIAFNGFWGMESGEGSLSAVKEMMRASGKFTQTEIDRLTEGIAMTATQYAIWFSSNRAKNTIYLNAYYTEDSGFSLPAEAADKDAADLIFKLCFHLMDMEEMDEPVNDSAHTIINDKNFLSEVSLSLRDKPASLAVNQDDDDTNDLYIADLSFRLAVKPLQTDDLFIEILDENGARIGSGRIAGTLQPGETMVSCTGGLYTISGVPLKENKQSLRFVLKGDQQLERDAYLYLSQKVDGEESQPLVSVAKGVHTVDVDMTLSFSLSAEDEELSIERVWRTEKTIPNVPPTGDDANLLLWAGLCVLSLLGAWLMAKKARA